MLTTLFIFMSLILAFCWWIAADYQQKLAVKEKAAYFWNAVKSFFKNLFGGNK